MEVRWAPQWQVRAGDEQRDRCIGIQGIVSVLLRFSALGGLAHSHKGAIACLHHGRGYHIRCDMPWLARMGRN